jgi:16S rRNA (cytidine1402-2'-O)-methyltransferase
MIGTLYIVPTPIGNLEDITLRALRVLKEVDLILCEDTSVTQKLLKKYEIENKTSVFYTQSGKGAVEKALSLLEEGKSIALVSDAGTPAISDPGTVLVDATRKRFGEESVVTLPGASALTTALSGSGIDTSQFVFLGFMPHKKGRETLFKEIAESKRTVIFYESVHRIEKTLESLEKSLSESRRVVIARELSKLHEQIVRGGAGEVKKYFETHKDKIRGEFVVIVENRG